MGEDCTVAGCDTSAQERVNIPGKGWVDYCAFHARKVLEDAESVGLRLGMEDPSDG